MQIVHTVTEGSAVTGEIFNAAHVYSSLNRKMIAPVDNQGSAQLFGLNLKVYSGGACTTTIKTASNSYVTKQAVKAWYRVWRQKLKDADISLKDLGPYGRVFKPRFTSSQTLYGSGGEIGRGEWNWSDIVTTPTTNAGSGAIAANELTDQYPIGLLGSSVVTSGDGSGGDTLRYDYVGMIDSWLGSRKKPLGADDNQGNDSVDEDLVFDQDNPLLLARGGQISSQTMLDEVRDLQKDEPPYTENDFTNAVTQAIVQTHTNVNAECDFVAPCGLVQVTTTDSATLVFTLTGIGDM